MSSVEPKPWDGKCPHCGEGERIYPTGGTIGHMGPGPSNKVMICAKCNKHFYLTERTETTIMRTWISRNEPHEDYDIDRILLILYEEAMAIPRWKIWKWWPAMSRITKLELEHKNCCGTDPT